MHESHFFWSYNRSEGVADAVVEHELGDLRPG